MRPLPFMYRQVARLRAMGLQWPHIARIVGVHPHTLRQYCRTHAAYIAYERHCALALEASAPDALRTRVAAEIVGALANGERGETGSRRRRGDRPQ